MKHSTEFDNPASYRQASGRKWDNWHFLAGAGVTLVCSSLGVVLKLVSNQYYDIVILFGLSLAAAFFLYGMSIHRRDILDGNEHNLSLFRDYSHHYQVLAIMAKLQRDRRYRILANEELQNFTNLLSELDRGKLEKNIILPPHQLAGVFVPLLMDLKLGEEWCTVSKPQFWSPVNIGGTMDFINANRTASRNGAKIKRAFVVPPGYSATTQWEVELFETLRRMGELRVFEATSPEAFARVDNFGLWKEDLVIMMHYDRPVGDNTFSLADRFDTIVVSGEPREIKERRDYFEEIFRGDSSVCLRLSLEEAEKRFRLRSRGTTQA